MVRLISVFVVMSVVVGSVSAQDTDNLNRDEKVVAATILAEARGEGHDGMRAVACVIKQRSIERKMTVAAICLQKWQFSCWNDGDTPDELYETVTVHTKKATIEFAVSLAKDLVAGKDPGRELVKFANHYCTFGVHPKWAKGKTPVAVIGHHRFYKL